MNNVIDQKSIPAIEALLQNEELMHDLSETTTPEDVVNAFAKHELALPLDMAKEVIEKANDEEYLNSIVFEDELLEDELENVTGGFSLSSAVLIYIGIRAICFIYGAAKKRSEKNK